MSAFELVIDEAEWESVMRMVVPFVDDDEREGVGMVAVVADGARRSWWATDSYRMVRLLADGADSRDYFLIVSPRLLASWPMVAGDSASATLSVTEVDGVESIQLSGAGGSASSPILDVGFPPVDEFAEEYDEQAGPSAVVDAIGLYRFVTLSRQAPSGPFLDDDRVEPLFRLAVTGDALVSHVDWDELGSHRHALAAATTGTGEVEVNPRFLAEVVDVLDPADATVVLPGEGGGIVRIVQDSFTAYVMPRPALYAARIAVEHVLADCFGHDAVRADEDGDYELSVYGVPVLGRLLDDEPARLRLFAPVVHDVEAEAELLGELNALNNAYGFVKVVWEDGDVIVEGDLVAETIDAAEVMALHDRVRFVANELGPTLAAVYGGRRTERGEAARWAAYLRTSVLAELVPGERIDLTGPDAVVDWPFPAEVHVVTAWNPFGRVRPARQNQEQNALLAASLLRAGASSIRADGVGMDDDYSEEGLAVWGLDTDVVLAIAAAYEQEAVYRMDADRLEVLGVFSDDRAERARCAWNGAVEGD